MPQANPAVMNKEFLSLVPKAREVAQKNGINPALFLSLIQRESSGDQSKTSHKGAIGLTQLLPETAERMGANPFDQSENLEGGAKFLGSLLKRYGGKEDLALAAYNAGPGRVKNGKVPRISETLKYIKAIQDAKPYYDNPYYPTTDYARHNAYGKGNINLFSRPAAARNTTAAENGEQKLLLPTVDRSGTQSISPQAAFAQYKDTGKHLGKFDSIPESDQYAKQLHIDAEKGFYTPPLATSEKDVDSERLNSVLEFMLTGNRNTIAPDKSYYAKLLQH